MRVLEKEWGADAPDEPLASRFYGVIRRAFEKTGKNVVVLIDEYDKPLVQHLENDSIQEELRSKLKSFYGILKSADPWLRFVFITGVSKFTHVSIFSDLNQLRDISMEEYYAGICGITETKLIETFEHEITLSRNHMKYPRRQPKTFKARVYGGKTYLSWQFCNNNVIL